MKSQYIMIVKNLGIQLVALSPPIVFCLLMKPPFQIKLYTGLQYIKQIKAVVY